MEEKKCNCNEIYDSDKFQGGYPYCPVHDKRPAINHDRVIANQVAGMPWEEAIFQDGYSAGVEFEKKRAKPGPVWVKASEYKSNSSLAEYRPYRKDRSWDEFNAWDYGEIVIKRNEDGALIFDVGDGERYMQNHEHWNDYEILDESGAPTAGREEDAVAIFEELWDEHSEYIDDDIDSLSRWAGSTVVDKEQFKTVVAKMWELFKQQKEK